ncbi:hypothetical protein EV426DRAFT_577708 [Tirmania nivea]|nr:hypothetical protein EV426DRAFT_577708 [Tirmania nivea]
MHTLGAFMLVTFLWPSSFRPSWSILKWKAYSAVVSFVLVEVTRGLGLLLRILRLLQRLWLVIWEGYVGLNARIGEFTGIEDTKKLDLRNCPYEPTQLRSQRWGVCLNTHTSTAHIVVKYRAPDSSNQAGAGREDT